MHWKLLLKIVKWGYVAVSEVVGLAGIPDDVKQWETWTGKSMEQVTQFVNLYPVRVFLVVTGLLVVTYPRWWIPTRQLIFTKEDSNVVPPPTVTPHGGGTVSLEVRASVSARHYGYVWFTGENVTRTEKSDLLWQSSDSDREHLFKGDLGTVRIGGLYPHGYHQSDGRDFYVHRDSERIMPFTKLGNGSLGLRVELRAEGVEKSWVHDYCIRKVSPDSVVIEEV